MPGEKGKCTAPEDIDGDFRNVFGSEPMVNVSEKQSVIRLAMPWRNKTNTIDSLIFVMRHMEIFQGQKESGWNPQPKAGGYKKFSSLLI